MTLQERVSATQASERVELAAAYRLVAHFGMDDSIFTHISARAPAGEGDHAFLINPYGLRFDEVTASNLVTVDLEGNILRDSYGAGLNKAGFTIHSAVHEARPDVMCVLHTHTVAGVAISCLEEGILPLNQWSLGFHKRVAFHDYEGVALNLEERARLVADLGDLDVMILRNHGMLTCGRTVGEAFKRMYNLERTCRAQLQIMASGGKMRFVEEALADHVGDQFANWSKMHGEEGRHDAEWEAYMRLAKKHHPDFDS
ncbi:class II aldolase/adducin family protein [Paroceanicella profunda]|uniref:Class II aldolase/adducin family protein n=1 Tax=Paroceanicella profunda TaxID=2579971 RepID=A0A5B8FSH0_9RHOB|nr:class II aldolase/adducin family protein [Paroceanicella profunda]QDL91716.1 class II aldolase/adducin family protein [Paroceanicella profunda]